MWDIKTNTENHEYDSFQRQAQRLLLVCAAVTLPVYGGDVAVPGGGVVAAHAVGVPTRVLAVLLAGHGVLRDLDGLEGSERLPPPAPAFVIEVKRSKGVQLLYLAC